MAFSFAEFDPYVPNAFKMVVSAEPFTVSPGETMDGEGLVEAGMRIASRTRSRDGVCHVWESEVFQLEWGRFDGGRVKTQIGS